MYELTTGDERFIGESTTIWMTYIRPIMVEMEEVPEEVKERINTLEKSFIAGFRDYYIKEKDEENLSDPILYEYDRIFSNEHPEYYDVDLLFAGCSDEALKKAERTIKEAKEAFDVSYEE